MFMALPLGTSPAVIAGLFVLFVWIVSGRFLSDWNAWFRTGWFWAVLLLMALPWVGLLWSDDPEFGRKLAGKSYYWLFAFAAAPLWRLGRSPRIFIDCFLAGLSVNVGATFLQFFEILPQRYTFPGLVGHITYSVLLVFGILLLSFYYREASDHRRKFFFLLLLALLLLALTMVQGRTGYLAFILLSPWILLNLLGKRRLLWAVVATPIMAGALFLSPKVQERVTLAAHQVRTFATEGDRTTPIGLRFHMWEGALRIIADHPLSGVGAGGYGNAMTRWHPDPSLPKFEQPHNSFLHMTVSYGLFGVLPLLWILVHLLKKGWRSRRSMGGFAVLAFAVVLIIASLTDTQVLSLATGKLFALFTGLAAWPDRRLRGELHPDDLKS